MTIKIKEKLFIAEHSVIERTLNGYIAINKANFQDYPTTPLQHLHHIVTAKNTLCPLSITFTVQYKYYGREEKDRPSYS